MTWRIPLCLAAAGLAVSTLPQPAFAADKAQAEPPKKVISITVYGNDPCPQSQGEEIVVCAREPESERYRVPKRFRKPKEKPPEKSWKSRAEIVDEATRATRPNSCSVVGSGGQTGCTAEMLRQWQLQKQAQKAAEAEAGGKQ